MAPGASPQDASPQDASPQDATLEFEDPATSPEYCAPYKPRDTDGSVLLANYIHDAEDVVRTKCKSLSSLFLRHPVAPRLFPGKVNRILVFSGCFNPPHLGHLELFTHVFLRTDHNTIGAMIVLKEKDICTWNKEKVNGSTFYLRKKQRALLWEDDILGRFAWVHQDKAASVPHFQATMIKLAKADGFELEFTGLDGSDHYAFDANVLGKKGSLITSDVTRPSVLLRNAQKEPKRIVGCGEWRKILPARGVSKGRVTCWACWKFQMLYPELVGEGAANIPYTSGLGGIAGDILQRCHESDNVVWWCQRNKGGKAVWLFLSGRIYLEDERRPAISSTKIRNLLDQGPRNQLYCELRGLTMNAQWLLQMMRYVQYAEESDLEAEDGYDDSLRGNGRDYQETKLKIKALSQSGYECGSTRMPGKMKDDRELGQTDSPDQSGPKKGRSTL